MTIEAKRRGDGRMYIGGTFVEGAAETTGAVVEKATGREIGRYALGDAGDVDRAVAAAKAAQPAWAAATFEERAAVLRRVADRFAARLDEFADIIVRETGGVPAKGRGEVGVGQRKLLESAALAGRPYGELLPSPRRDKLAILRHDPLGVVAVITPWNFPVVLGMRGVAPALAVGNTVVLKPASLTPICGGQFLAELFAEADAPAGIFNVVTGSGGSVGEPLAAHPDVAMIHFTGSTEVGREMALIAARALKPCELELGGDNAIVVLDDADVEEAASCGAWAAWEFQGQTCITAGRHIVMRPRHDGYVESVVRRARGIVVGDPTQPGVGLGPLISEDQLAKVEGIVRRTVEMGARLVEGGSHDGLFYRPTVLDGVTPEMPAFTEEIFGPILPITTVDTEAEALRLVNSQRNLVSAVYTGDLIRGMAFAEKVDAGLIHVNDAMGRPTGENDLLRFTRPRWIGLQRTPVSFPY